MNIIDKILSRCEFIEEPPILLDIGASGETHRAWKDIAKYSMCIAFDADDREISFAEKETGNYKKLYVFNRIVTDQDASELDFYLTKSPYCSSTLLPDYGKIQDWEFAGLFHVENTIKLKAVTLKAVIEGLGLKRIDWFKTDSQGTDLRLFKSLGEEIIITTLVAEFEPGIIDVYRGEDKLHHLMSYMDKMPFWMSNINILGCRRINQFILKSLNNSEKEAIKNLRTSPNWAEVIYLNSFHNEKFSKRDYLLGCIFAIIEKQYGFSLELSIRGYEKYRDKDFKEIEKFSIAQMMSDYDEKVLSEEERMISLSPHYSIALRRILRGLIGRPWFSNPKALRNLKRVGGKDVRMAVVRDTSSMNNRPSLKVKCHGYRHPQFRFWGRKDGEFVLLKDWGLEDTCILLEQDRGCSDYGVHIRSGGQGDWQNQVWVKNEGWERHD